MSKLAQLFAAVNGSTFIGLETTTEVKLTGGKKNPMQGRVQKHSKGASLMVFQNKTTNAYENMVNRRLKAEGKSTSFVVGERAWGTRLPNLPIVEHKGQHYLEVIYLAPGTSTYTLDGLPIAKSAIEGLKAPAPSTGQEGLHDQVTIRTFKVQSITKLTLDKVDYTQANF